MEPTQADQHVPLPILKHNGKHYRLDLTGKRVTFLDKRFYFTSDGISVPSVTTILDAYPKGAAFFEWLKRQGENADEIRDEAGRRGSKVHNLTERYDNGEEVSLLTADGEIGMSMLEWSMFERYVRFREKNPHLVPVVVEQNFVDGELGYGGTVDRVFMDNRTGNRVLVDIKTSSSVHEHYWLQVAAYKNMANKQYLDADPYGNMLKECHIHAVAILWLNSSHRTEKTSGGQFRQGIGWQFIYRDASAELRDLSLFGHTHKMWLAQNEGAQPRQTSYQIVHKYQPAEFIQALEQVGAELKGANGKGTRSK